jgi:serine O-acetyltransferase
MRNTSRNPRTSLVSSIYPDWSRERCGRFEWRPSRRLMRAFRAHEHARQQKNPISRARRVVATLSYRFWSSVCGTDIALDTDIGGGLLMPHPEGIVIHPHASLGPNCLLMQQVTLGVGGTIPGAPRLEGHVDVGAGAKILGGVHIGEHARIGANAVVLCDVPAGCTAVGVPARVLPRTVLSLASSPTA